MRARPDHDFECVCRVLKGSFEFGAISGRQPSILTSAAEPACLPDGRLRREGALRAASHPTGEIVTGGTTNTTKRKEHILILEGTKRTVVLVHL